jgi:hypothetical protein
LHALLLCDQAIACGTIRRRHPNVNVQAENFSKFIEAAQCVSERGLYEAFGFGAVNPL